MTDNVFMYEVHRKYCDFVLFIKQYRYTYRKGTCSITLDKAHTENDGCAQEPRAIASKSKQSAK